MSEWDQRMLCPDGACVGVIGPDGTCKVCGRVAPNWGDERTRGLSDEADADANADAGDAYEDDDEDYEDDDADEEEAGDDEPAGEWNDRKLCPDGACVGLIGENGTCNVCGRSAA